MHIYVDEAGPFATPKPGISKISCVGGLAVPQGREAEVRADYDRLRAIWGTCDAEVKGGLLNEEQAAELIAMLIPYDVVVHVAAIDMGLYTDDAKTQFKNWWADSLIMGLPPGYPPPLVDVRHQLRDRIRRTSNVLAVQMYLAVTLLQRTQQLATAYYARRCPAESGEPAWIFDAKDIRLAPHEQLFPSVASAFLGFEAPPYITYADSRNQIGLQLADNVVTICRRALNETLTESGWGEIGRLFVRDSGEPLSYLRLDGANAIVLTEAQQASLEHHKSVMRKIREKSRGLC